MGARLYVGNLSFNSTEGDVLDLFKQAGTVVRCELVVDKFTNRSRGFAFVEMGSPEDGQQAIQRFNGAEFQGRTLTVNEARPREERAPREFAGGRGERGMREERGGGGGSRRGEFRRERR